MLYKEYKCNTYNVYTVKTDKFKTCHMEIIFRNNIDKATVTKRSLLSEMLVENSNIYKTKKDMNIELENLYNSFFYSVINRVGSSILTSYCFDFIDPNLVNENIEEFIKFPIINIMNPNVLNNEFENNTFNYVKQRVKKDIESIIEEPKKYSIKKLLENMCNTESSIDINGNIEDLEMITPTNLFEFYNECLQHDYIDIYIIGNLNMDNVVEIIKNNFNLNILKNHEVLYEVKNPIRKKVKEISLDSDFSQENICFGYNIDNMTEYERNYVANIYNMILGGSSLDTKLYNNLRNENSLCYNCSSLYQKFDNLIIIHTAISKENENLAIKLIKKSINDMINNIDETELENAKKLISTTLNMALDNPGKIIDNYLFKNLYNLEDIEIRINKYNNVTLEEIKEFSKKVKLNTILCLKEAENGKN